MMNSNLRQFYIILLITFVGFVGISIAYPIFPPLFLKSHSNLLQTTWEINHRNILLGLTLSAYPFGQFVGSPIIGALSDRFGRRKLLLSSLIGSVIGNLLSAYALKSADLTLLMLSRFIAGLGEGNIAIAQAMIADLKDINKHKGFGNVLMAASLGYILGPLVGGFLSNTANHPWFTTSLPFSIAALLSAITLLLTYFVLSETRSKINKPTHSYWHEFNLFKHFSEIYQQSSLKILLVTTFLFLIGVDIFYEFGPVYLTGRWNMNAQDIAIYNVFLCLGLALSGFIFAHRLASLFSPQLIVNVSISLFSLCMLLIIITKTDHLLIVLFASLGILISIAQTCLRVQLSDYANEDIQGKIMGVQASLRVLGNAIICIIGGFLIAYSVLIPLIISAIIALIAAMYYFRTYRILSSVIN